MLQSVGSQRARRDWATGQQTSSLNTSHSGARTDVYSCLRIAETSTSKEWTEVRLINAWCQEIIISEVIFFYLYQWREHRHLLKGAKQFAQIMLSTISYIWFFFSLLKKKQNQDLSRLLIGIKNYQGPLIYPDVSEQSVCSSAHEKKLKGTPWS